MLRAVIVSPDAELAAAMEDLLARAGTVNLVKTTNRYLTSYDLERFMRANAPQVVFLDIAALNEAVQCHRGMDAIIPGVQTIAFGRRCEPDMLLALMNLGIREFLPAPIDYSALIAALTRIHEILDKRPARIDICDNVFSFLPSKAGAGTSTIALNTAIALSSHPDIKTLLVDMDLNSGLLGFMLRLDSSYTIYEAAENSARLDEHLWPQLVNSVHSLDVLPAGRLDPQARIDSIQVRQLIAFARRFYKAICIDLSGNMEKFSMEVMQESRRIFLVCTPEIPTLHLARQKLRLIQQLELGDRVTVLLNRAQKKNIISTGQIEQLLGVPIAQEFPNDYRGVHMAVTQGREVDPSTELGRGFTTLANKLLETNTPAQPKPGRRRFVEFFSVLPKYS